MSPEITTAGTWESLEDPDVDVEWPTVQSSSDKPYGSPKKRAPVTVQRTGTETRHVTVNRDPEGEVLGVAIMLNELELRRLGAELDGTQGLEYWVEDGRIRFSDADSTKKGVSSHSDG